MGATESENEFLPTTYLTVLTLIGRGARYGYEINSLIERHGYREWVDLRFSTVYKALKELEARGLLKSAKEDETKKTSRKIYSLTRRGMNILKKQIFMCLSGPPRSKTLFDLGMSAMCLLTKDEVLEALDTYRNNLQNNLNFLQQQIEGLKNLERYKSETPEYKIGQQRVTEIDDVEELQVVLALFDRPAHGVQAQLTWLTEFIRLVEIGDGFKFTSKK
ncbi:MAG: PadR family transcriptional regulator [Candidatus Thorarchaeota archaeon]